MFRYFFLSIVSFLFFSCEDGEILVESFDFTNSTTQTCNQNTSNFFIYRLSTNEALIIRMPESTFNYAVTPLEASNELDPISVEGSAIDVVYRLYNGAVSTSTLCSTLPAISPIVTEEWTATSGNIRVVTNVTKISNAGINSPNATKINGYNHEIELRGITFVKPDGTEVFYDVLTFGSYQTAAANTLSDEFPDSPTKCNNTTNVKLYKTSTNQAIVLEVPTSLFPNEITAANTPRVAYFDSQNTFKYLIFEEVLANDTAFCAGTFDLAETWLAQDGNATTQSGRIEVTTIQSSEGFEHTIVLKKAVMMRGDVEFTFGDAYTLGTFKLTP